MYMYNVRDPIAEKKARLHFVKFLHNEEVHMCIIIYRAVKQRLRLNPYLYY